MAGWSADSGAVLVVSEVRAHTDGFCEIISIPVTGDVATPMNLGFADFAWGGEGDGIMIGRNTRDPCSNHWKRYKGGTYGEVWLKQG